VSRLLAIVPAHNEIAAIAATVREIQECAPDFDVLVIDDGSTDGTAATAAAAGANVIRLPFNLGIGGAVQTGYVYAAENGFEVAVQVDGDGQHDAADPEVERQTDHVRPGRSRFLESGEGDFRSSASRRAGIRIFSRLLSVITGQAVTDPTSGFRMVNRTGIELFARDYPHDYPEVEAILLMHAHRLRSGEIPVKMRPRTTGESAISSATPIYYMVKVLLAVFVGLFRRHPTIEPGDTPVHSSQPL
jgi:glycosyltransferase involved in cell wall biosynthesis